MYGTEQVLTSRETSGIQIPDGTPVTEADRAVEDLRSRLEPGERALRRLLP